MSKVLSVPICRVVFNESTVRTWVHDQLVLDPERGMPTYAHRHTFSTPPEITDLFFLNLLSFESSMTLIPVGLSLGNY